MSGRFVFYRDSNGRATVDFEVKIPGGIYPVTTCVVDEERFNKGQRTFPCGSGDDHHLTDAQAKTVRNLLMANAVSE